MHNTTMPTLSVKTADFIAKMADRRFGTFIISGDRKSGKTTLVREYLRTFQKNVRATVLVDEIFPYSEFRPAASVRFIRKSREESCENAIRAILEDRPSVLVVDLESITPEGLQLLGMAALTCNVVFTYNALGFGDVIQDINEQLDLHPSSLLTRAGFWSQLKGLAITHEEKTGYVQEALESNDALYKLLTSANHLTSDGYIELGVSLMDQSKRQGYPSRYDQVQGRRTPLSLAAKMAFQQFLDGGPGLAVISGTKDSGQSAALEALWTFAQSTGNRELTIISEVKYTDALTRAIREAETKQVVISCTVYDEANSHYGTIDGLDKVAGREYRDRLLSTLRFIGMVQKDQTPFLRPFLPDRALLNDAIYKQWIDINEGTDYVDQVVREQGF